MTALIVIIGIILVFALLLYFSFTVYVSIKEDVNIKVGAYGLKFDIIPSESDTKKPKKKRKKKKKQESTKSEKPKKKVEKQTFAEIVELILSAVKSILKPTAKLMSKIRLTAVDINIAVCGEEADKTAIKFGEITTAIYSTLGYLNQLIKVKIKRVDIRPDFVGDEDRYDITFKIKLRLYQILGAGFRIAFGFFANIIKAKMKSSATENTAIKVDKK